MINFELGGVVIPDMAGFNLQQRYSPVDGGSAVLRSMNGTAVKMTHWEKTRIVTSATGWIPPALQMLDYASAMTMKCIAPMHAQSASNVITISADRRIDTGADPFGMALVGDDWVDTAVSMSVDEATLTTVTGATLYRVGWYPQFTVYAARPQDNSDLGGPSYSWTLEAEQA
jgi:hypothetical protein